MERDLYPTKRVYFRNPDDSNYHSFRKDLADVYYKHGASKKHVDQSMELMHGAGLFDFIKKGIEVGKKAYDFYDKHKDTIHGVGEAGIGIYNHFNGGSRSGGSRSGGKISGGRRKSTNSRHEMVRKIMREKGYSLPQASKYIKDHDLY
jgi:hypothetical protein